MDINEFNNFYDRNEFRNTAKKLKGRLIAVIAVFAVVVGLIVAAGIYLDIIQLNEIGKKLSSIYIKNIQYKLIFSVFTFILIFAAISVTNIFIKRVLFKFLKKNGTQSNIKFPNYSIAAVIGLLGAFITRNFFFQKALTFFNSEAFNLKDPLFSKDVGYYIFQRPFLISIYDFILYLWIFVIFYTIAYYLISLILVYSNVSLEDLKFKSLIRHNIINVSIFFLIKAVSYTFEKEGLLFGSFANVRGVGSVLGAGYIANNIWKLYFTIAPFLLLAIVAVTFFFVWRGKLKSAGFSIAIYPAVWIVVSIIAAITQVAYVKPDEINAEGKYLKNNMTMTRKAYNIDNIESYPFKLEPLKPEIIARNKETVDNIRVVDYKATLDSNKQLQGLTNFYSFHEGDIINYNINGKETPVFISAREINKDLLQSKSYTNMMFKYTHGYGIVMNPINRFTREGQSDFIISGLQNEETELKINEPRIYYGELTKDYVVVNPAQEGKLKETDYDGKTEVSYDTQNGGGIKLGFLNKVLFALRFHDYNFLVSSNISSNSKLLLNRQVVERAQKAVPFLRVDNDPYILLTDDGKLKWILDAYTTTNLFPYSQDFGGFNYIRNSVKIIIDAYTGATDYYIIDNNDPIIKVYNKIYPGIFNSMDKLPEFLKQHMRYPEYLFKLQTEVLKKYHINPDSEQNITNFYGGQDLWKLASIPDKESGEEVLEPYYNMIKLPGKFGKNEELILMRPFTPSGERHNLGSWLSVRNSMENYGQLIQFTFPNEAQNIFGPYQVEVKINQIDSISKDITLWSQSGSAVFKGNLLVIPIENSILYVEPIYIRSTGNAIPEVRRIITGYQEGNEFRYGIGTDLRSALNNMFSANPATVTDDKTDTTTDNKDAGNDNEDKPSQNVGDKQQVIDQILSKYDVLKKQMDELDKLMQDLR
ncbi:UPF0182 family protein [Pseudobacteroides cellulosolvens]|uniref:Uncharacterized protein n=1 Tax=Pseudobacteroides cellulosolvens ATCC 35603 = DSM 2933 TaxID=398512 RepID=A0A0L6JK87_9FIRM|nr:UPF0182 family protein [Pseudobacteroides cellulosolvens]KNY25772.1 protein of unknown function UPF0182 [Pseudobacteroides cellulosolvens ATCC 35603 = DSM 2933]